ncbi:MULTISPECIES: ABC transporter permease [unclassified Brevibacterium]|uniref:ABC transporter permease n=1 Tax=unclassified Brevibacterium TaxID=2614124 RepID=UPI000C617700|nr:MULTISPECIES: ABC transporter permease [unclassified Brevibacterium]SMX84159.1 spermidine/putrescine transport system permease protein [Brevibacterium sp. 239c]
MAFTTRKPFTDKALDVWGILVFIYLFLPIAVIVVYSFNNGTVLANFKEFGFQAYVHGLANDVIMSSVWTSLKAAFGSALVATIFGTLGGVALARARRGAWWAIGLTVILAATLFTPEIVDGIAFLPWFVTLGVDWGLVPFNDGMFRLIISHAMFSMAVVTFIVRARLAGMNRQLEEASADLGATPIRTFANVTLPIAAPGIFAGALMSFTLSLDNTILSSFVQLPGSTPWPVYIFAAVKVALRPEIAAVSTLMFLLTLVALGVCALALKKTGGSSTEIIKTMAG